MAKKILFLLAALALLGLAQTSHAAVVVSRATPTGPVMTDPGNGFPIYYSDGTTQLVPCLTMNPADPVNNPYCVLLADEAFDAVNPVIFPINFPLESFYWYAEADTTNLGPNVVKIRFAIEATFSNFPTEPADGWQTVFQGIRIWLVAPSTITGPSTYTVTHPYGSYTFNATTAGELLRMTTDVPGGIPLDFAGVQDGSITNFLRCADCLPIVDAAGNEYIADPLVPHPVLGGPNGNIVTVTGPDIGGPGINTVSTNLFLMAGKKFNGVLPTALSVSRASYSRTAANATQLDVFAASNAGATVSYREAGSAIDVPMAEDILNPLSSRFYGKSSPAAPPASVLVTAFAPSAANTTITANVTDAVYISNAQFNVACNTLDIDASSSDEFAPPALTATGLGALAARGTAPNQGLTLTQTGGVNLAPPAQVKVASSRGGSATRLVTVVPNIPPTAVNDVALATAGTPTTINVIINDSDVETAIDPATVTIITTPATGSAVAQANGTVVYTPNIGASRIDTFQYTVKDATCPPGTVTATSQPATVTITVAGAATPPSAGNLSASTLANTAVSINALASVTTGSNQVNQASVAVVPGSGPSSGVLSAPTATGLVTYTPGLNFAGTDSFQYTVADIAGLVSNAATVTIAVTSPAGGPPVAGNIAASTLSNTAVTINVLASVTTGTNPVNPATLAIVPGSGPIRGSVASNGTGAITYTPNLNYVGTDSFQYTITDTFGLLSNAATVSLTVQNTPPVASPDAATTAQRTAVIINVLANDVDPDGTINPATVAIVSAPSVTNGGTVSVNAVTGAITYTPGITAAGAFFSGADTFTYTVNDNLGAASNTATATVNVGATAEALTVKSAQYEAAKLQWKINGSSTQRVGNAMTLELVRGGATLGTLGTANVGANGSWQFQFRGSLGLTPAPGDIVRASSRFGNASTRVLSVK